MVQKTLTWFFCSHDDSFEPILFTSSEPVGHLLKKVNKLARNLAVPVKGPDLTKHQWKMLIALESPKLKDTESSADICQVFTE